MNIVGSGTSATKIPDIINQEQGKSIFAGLDSGTDTETGSLVSGSLKGMLSGSAYAPYEQQSQEKLARAAQNLRTSVGSSYANKMNQGSANKAMNQADQNIFSSISDTNLNLATEKQAMKERGISTALDIAKAQEGKRLSDLQTGMAVDTAYGYVDQFGNKVRGSNILQGEQVDVAKQQAQTAKELGYANLELDRAKLAESARQFGVSTDQAEKQFNAMLQKDYASLSIQEKQFLMSLGLDQAKFEESKKQFSTSIALDQAKLAETARQFNISTDQVQSQFNETLKKDYAQLSSQEKQFLQSLGLDQAKFEESKKQFATTISLDKAKLDETARQFNISSEQANKQFYDSLKKDYAALSQNDKQFLSSLGLDQAKFEEIKAQNANQNNLAWAQLKSSEQIALKQIGVDESKLAETARQFNISTDNAVKQFQDTMNYNYADLSQKDKQFLASLGLDQNKFEYQKEFDRNSLQFNYDQLDANTKLAYDKMSSDEQQFYAGLASSEKINYAQMNSNERIAYQDNQTKLLNIASNEKLTMAGIISNAEVSRENMVNDLRIAGAKISSDQDIARMQLDSAEKLAANSNYLAQQGINLQEAALKGFPDQYGKHVMGSIEIAAQELGLKATELDLMEKELLGDPTTGLQGKLAIMNEEQKLKAKELIGYDKTNTDGTPMLDSNGKVIHVNGTLEAQQAQVDIQKSGLDLDKERFTDSKVRDNYSIALAAGDYAGANNIARAAGIPTIDYTKQEDREALQKVNDSMNNAREMLAMIGDSATPEQIQQFATIYANAWSEKEKLLGVPFEEGQLDSIIKSFETNTDSKDNGALNTYVSSTVMDWWDSGEGMMYSGQLQGKYSDLQQALATGVDSNGVALTDQAKEDAAAQMGQLVWARYAASSGKYLTSNQINMLTEAGLIDAQEKASLPQSLTAEKEGAAKVEQTYNSVIDKLSATGAQPGSLVAKTGTEGKYMQTLQLGRSEINDIINYEKENPADSNYLTDVKLTGAEFPKDENLVTNNVGKIIQFNDNYLIPLGLFDTNTREWDFYNVTTGQKVRYALRKPTVLPTVEPYRSSGGSAPSSNSSGASYGNPGTAV
jgi:hypothetical protein